MYENLFILYNMKPRILCLQMIFIIALVNVFLKYILYFKSSLSLLTFTGNKIYSYMNYITLVSFYLLYHVYTDVDEFVGSLQ